MVKRQKYSFRHLQIDEFALIATSDEAIVTNFEKKKQKMLNHLSESTVRAIYRFGED